ncbi:MAG: RHS repeat protein, partial [Acidobacteria bacterium]|nr:RHS repeat protein [Acidobacteriota bacterium]
MFSWKRNIVAIFIALKMVTLVVGQTNPPPRQTPNVITTSPTTQSIPTGLAKGVNPLGSYGGSNFDKINLFNGNVSMSFPLASLTSRGGMSAGVVLSYNSKLWYVDKVETDVTARIINEPSTVSVAYIPSYSEPDPEISSLGAGWTIHAGSLRVVSTAIYNKANRTCVFPGPGVQPVKPEKTISIVTFTAPDGTTYDFRDRIYDGEPRFLVNCEGVSRGKRFESKDGTSATFVSDTEIKDGFFSLSNTNISGYVYLRDGTRFRIEQGRVVKQRDNNGNIIEYTYEGNRLKRVTDNMGRTIEVRYDVSARILATVTVKGILGQARVTTIRGGRLENHLAANESRKNIDELFPVEAVQMSVPGFSFNPRTVSEVILPDSDPSGSPEGHEWEFKYNSYGEVVRVKTPARGVVEFDMGPNIGLNNGGYDTILNQIFRRVVARRTYPSDNGPIEGKVTYSDPTDPAKIDNGDVTVEQTEVDPNDGERILSKSTHKFSGHPKRGLDRMGGTPARTGYRPWLEGKELETEQFNFDGTTAMRRTITKYKQQSGVAWVAGADENTLAQPENNPRVTKITNSLLDGTTPKTSKTDYEYDQFNNVTRETLTGYNNEIIRQVERTYISTLNGIDYTSLNAQEGQDLETVLDTHLRSLIDTETIKNASGDAENTAKYEYDQYSGTNNAALVPRTLTVNTHAQRYQSPSRVQRGNVTSVTTGVGKPEASILYSHYDVLGNVVEVLGPNPEQRTETIYELTSQFTFPEQTKQYVSGGVSGNRVLTSSRSFDFDTGAVLSSTGFNGDITSFQYNDQLDRLTLEIRPLDNAQGGFGRTSYTYSAPGAYPNTVEVKTSLDNGRVLTSKSEFDGFLRTTRQRRTDPNGEVKSETFYDALGRVEKITNPFRQTSSTTDGYTISQYDALSRVFRIQTFDNANNLTGTVNTLYDTNLVTVTDQAGKQRKSETDAAGRLVKVYEPSSEFNILDQITSYRYDARSNLEQVNQGVQVRTFAYDALSRLISATSPESGSEFSSGTTTYQYDDASNLTRKVDARNITTIYTYDSLNRLATKNYSNSTPDVSYFYDVIPSSLPSGVFLPPSFSFQNTLGRKTAMASASTSSQSATAWFHTYDVGGRITKNSQLLSGRHHTSENDYNLASLPTQHTYPSGKVIAHNYNIAGQLSQVTRNGFLLSKEIEYTASGSLSVQSLGNSLEHSIKYNSRLQPTSISLGTSVSTSASDKMRIDYVYGTLTDNGIVQENRNNGNIARITLTSGSSDPITQDFKYDELNRLSKASEYANNQFCEFDNRVLFKSDNVRETDTHFEILSSPGDNSGAGATIAFELNLGDRQAGNGQHLYLVAERLSVVIPPNTSRVSAGLDLDTNGVNFEIDNQDFNTRRSASFEYFAASADNPNALAIDALASDFGLTNIFRPTLILDSASGVVRFNLSLGIFYNTSQTELPEVIARIPKKLKFICTTKVPAKVFGNATLPCSSARDVTFNYVDPNDPSEGVIKIFGSLSNVIVRGEFIGSGQGQVAKVENVDCETFRLYATNSSGVDSLYSFQPTPPSANSLISKVEKDSATNLDIATNLSWQQEYVYDRYGNRKEVIGLNEQQLTISPNKNRITDAGYLYDNAGNLIADPSGKSYEYDGENRLIKVLSGFSVIATYEYDGSGLRVRKTANGVITHFIYNNSQLIAEYEGENLPPLSSPTKEYYYGASGLVATSDNNDPLHFHTPDHLGSPRVITNFDGKVIVRRDFLPFGESLDPSLGGRAFTSGYISNDSLR